MRPVAVLSLLPYLTNVFFFFDFSSYYYMAIICIRWWRNHISKKKSDTFFFKYSSHKTVGNCWSIVSPLSPDFCHFDYSPPHILKNKTKKKNVFHVFFYYFSKWEPPTLGGAHLHEHFLPHLLNKKMIIITWYYATTKIDNKTHNNLLKYSKKQLLKNRVRNYNSPVSL